MAVFLLNTVALDPHRWTPEKVPFLRLEDHLPELARRGFVRLELWQYHLSTLSPRVASSLFDRASALGVTFPVVGLYPVLHLEGTARETERREMDRLIAEADRFGAKVVKCFAGRLGSAEIDAAAFDRSVRFARHLAATAARHGLIMTVETHPDTLCDSVEATRRFLRAVEAPNLRVCFQPYDFTDTARTVTDLEALLDHVTHVHLQSRRDDRIALLEDAEVDYLPVFQTLQAGGFDGYLSLEFVRSGIVEDPADLDLAAVLADAERDRAHIRRTAEAAGLSLTL